MELYLHMKQKSMAKQFCWWNIVGNIYTENIGGINVHKYGAHIFHTNKEGMEFDHKICRV